MKANKLIELRHSLRLRSNAGKVAHGCGGGCKTDNTCGCDIPETPCPLECAAAVEWKITRGAEAKATLVVKNTGQAAQLFEFTPSPLRGLDVGAAHVTVVPASKNLQPGESVTVRVELIGSADLQAEQEYRAEIAVAGLWTQHVCISCQIRAEPYTELFVRQGGWFKGALVGAVLLRGGVDWEFNRGTVPELVLLLHNAAGSKRLFSVEPGPWSGTAAGASIVATPPSVEIEGGESAVVRVQLQDSASLLPRRTYCASLKVFGIYEQRIALRASVQPDMHAHVALEQGALPTRIRAHRWHDHFQCTEACPVH